MSLLILFCEIGPVLKIEHVHDSLDLPAGRRGLRFRYGDDEIDRSSDGLLHGRGRCLCDEIFQPDKAGPCIVGMNRGDAARVAGIPGFHEIKTFPTSNLAHDDAVWAVTLPRTLNGAQIALGSR